MIDYLERHCDRCGRAEWPGEKKAMVEAAIAAEGPLRGLPWPDCPLSVVLGGFSCEDCLTLAERRAEAWQCQRCGCNCEGDDPSGWIIGKHDLICPECAAPQEAVTVGEVSLTGAR